MHYLSPWSRLLSPIFNVIFWQFPNPQLNVWCVFSIKNWFGAKPSHLKDLKKVRELVLACVCGVWDEKEGAGGSHTVQGALLPLLWDSSGSAALTPPHTAKPFFAADKICSFSFSLKNLPCCISSSCFRIPAKPRVPINLPDWFSPHSPSCGCSTPLRTVLALPWALFLPVRGCQFMLTDPSSWQLEDWFLSNSA